MNAIEIRMRILDSVLAKNPKTYDYEKQLMRNPEESKRALKDTINALRRAVNLIDYDLTNSIDVRMDAVYGASREGYVDFFEMAVQQLIYRDIKENIIRLGDDIMNKMDTVQNIIRDIDEAPKAENDPEAEDYE